VAIKYLYICIYIYFFSPSRTRMELHPGPARKLYFIYHCWVYGE